MLRELLPGLTPTPAVPATCKRLALAIASKAGVSIDTGCYDHQRLVRLPNSRHTRTGLFKRFLTEEEFFSLGVEQILDLARHPAGYSPPRSGEYVPAQQDDFDESGQAVCVPAPTATGHDYPVVPAYVRDFIGFRDIQDPGRAVTLFRCAAVLAEAGTPDAVVRGLLEESALKSGLELREVDRQIRLTAKFTVATAVAGSSEFDPDTPPPPRFDPGRPFQQLDFRPGRVLLIGAPPGAGKTALALQVAAGALQNHPDLRTVVANVEMTPPDLLARVVGRLAGVAAATVTDKTYGPGEKERVRVALGLHCHLLDRLAFLEPPFHLEHLAAAADEFQGQLLVLDYLQRLGKAKDLRENLDGVMTNVRQLARAGAAVLAVSSVARQRDEKGRSAYSGLNLASFRGSSELEFGADSAYLLDSRDGVAVLRCEKMRYGRRQDIHLRFDAPHQRFDAGDPLDGFDAAPVTVPKGKR